MLVGSKFIISLIPGEQYPHPQLLLSSSASGKCILESELSVGDMVGDMVACVCSDVKDSGSLMVSDTSAEGGGDCSGTTAILAGSGGGADCTGDGVLVLDKSLHVWMKLAWF